MQVHCITSQNYHLLQSFEVFVEGERRKHDSGEIGTTFTEVLFTSTGWFSYGIILSKLCGNMVNAFLSPLIISIHLIIF